MFSFRIQNIPFRFEAKKAKQNTFFAISHRSFSLPFRTVSLQSEMREPLHGLMVAHTGLMVAHTSLMVAHTDLMVAHTGLMVALTGLMVAHTGLMVAHTGLLDC